MPCVGSILWAEPINEVLTAFETNGPAEKLYKPGIFSSTQIFDAKFNAVDDRCNTALWVVEHARIQGDSRLRPVFNVDLSR